MDEISGYLGDYLFRYDTCGNEIYKKIWLGVEPKRLGSIHVTIGTNLSLISNLAPYIHILKVFIYTKYLNN